MRVIAKIESFASTKLAYLVEQKIFDEPTFNLHAFDCFDGSAIRELPQLGNVGGDG